MVITVASEVRGLMFNPQPPWLKTVVLIGALTLSEDYFTWFPAKNEWKIVWELFNGLMPNIDAMIHGNTLSTQT